jgi:hypothetical protein
VFETYLSPAAGQLRLCAGPPTNIAVPDSAGQRPVRLRACPPDFSLILLFMTRPDGLVCHTQSSTFHLCSYSHTLLTPVVTLPTCHMSLPQTIRPIIGYFIFRPALFLPQLCCPDLVPSFCFWSIPYGGDLVSRQRQVFCPVIY